MILRNITFSFVILAMLLIYSCRTQKSVPPYGGALAPYNTNDTSSHYIQPNTSTNPSAEINREEETHQNLNKTRTTKKSKITNQRKKIIPKIDLCGLCQGFIMAKKARQIIQPPKTKGCAAGIVMLTWVIMLPILILIAGIIYFIAILTIIISVLLLAAVLAALTILILLGLGALTWLSGFLAIIGATVVASFLLHWLCKKCK